MKQNGDQALREQIASFGNRMVTADREQARLKEENAQLRKELMVANNRIERRDRMTDSIKDVLAGRECV